MKLKFKKQAYQTQAVEAVVACFAGQPKRAGLNYRIDPGRTMDAGGQAVAALETSGFKNADLALAHAQILDNIHGVQRSQNLALSGELVETKVCDINLDVEMETGTGKTTATSKPCSSLMPAMVGASLLLWCRASPFVKVFLSRWRLPPSIFRTNTGSVHASLFTTLSSCTIWKAFRAMRALM